MRTLVQKSYVLFLLSVFSSHLAWSQTDTAPKPPQNQGPKIECETGYAWLVMQFNVENAFDTVHDVGHEDWEYLPKDFPGRLEACKKLPEHQQARCLKTNWTEAKLEMKMDKIAKIIDAGPKKPHMVSLSEIENQGIADRIAQKSGFTRAIATNSPDERGIDVGLMFREVDGLKYVRHAEHDVSGETKKTRNILEVEFTDPAGEKLIVFVNHWPSQGAPAEARLEVALKLAKIIDEREAANPRVNIVGIGDFNVIEADRPDPFFQGIQNPAWRNKLRDLHSEYQKYAKSYKGDNPLRKMPPGTYFYSAGGNQMSWNVLDRIFYSEGMVTGKYGMKMDVPSYEILDPDFMKGEYKFPPGSPLEGSVVKGIPQRFSHDAEDAASSGWTDHFPIFGVIRQAKLVQ